MTCLCTFVSVYIFVPHSVVFWFFVCRYIAGEFYQLLLYLSFSITHSAWLWIIWKFWDINTIKRLFTGTIGGFHLFGSLLCFHLNFSHYTLIYGCEKRNSVLDCFKWRPQQKFHRLPQTICGPKNILLSSQINEFCKIPHSVAWREKRWNISKLKRARNII